MGVAVAEEMLVFGATVKTTAGLPSKETISPLIAELP